MAKRSKSMSPAEACRLLGETSRWKIIRALLSHGPMAIRDLASVAGRPRDTVSKHVHLLREHGLLQRSEKTSSDKRVEYFELAPDWRVEGDPLALDFGECQVRFGPRQQPSEPEKPVPAASVRGSWGGLPKRI
jgi:DNA-binding transcriptional ArsR family regulator